MTPAEQTAQAVKILVAIVAAVIVGVGTYAYVHHRLDVKHKQEACSVLLLDGTGDPRACD